LNVIARSARFPHAEREPPGDNHLTDITLDTGVATDTGRAWITVNGYFLTEVGVEGGRATVSELLGADAAAVQAIYIPGDSASARWISQAAQYSQKDTEPVTVIGRGSEADIVVNDSGVSRRHLELRITPTGVVATDLGSTNGSFVEGHRIDAATLLDGNQIVIGRTKILFWTHPDQSGV